MDKGIVRIYKYDQQNWPHSPPNTNVSIPQRSNTSVQTQQNSASDSSVGAHVVASSELYKRTNHNGNTDFKDNDGSRSFETPRKNNFSPSYFGDSLATTNTPCSSTLPPPGEEHIYF